MKILCLDTAMAACSAAVLDSDSALPLAAAFVAMERGHAEVLPPMVAGVMAQAGLDFAAIDRIAVTTGPGTFTGVRIGLAFARGLGLARGIPVIGIDSLSAIAANEPVARPLLVVSDARNAEVYAAGFDASRNITAAPQVTTASAAAASAAPGSLLLGTAAREVLAASGRDDLVLSEASPLPVAACFGRLAVSATPGDMPSPLYLRAPDAKPQATPLRKVSGLSIAAVDGAGAALLAALHGEIFDAGWSSEAMAALVATPGTQALVALEAGNPCGLLITRTAADEAEIITIGTRPSLQRRGVARQLMDHQLAALAASGVRQLFLEVAASNAAAQALYAALGFGAAGRRKDYYRRPEGLEDAIVMRRELIP